MPLVSFLEVDVDLQRQRSTPCTSGRAHISLRQRIITCRCEKSRSRDNLEVEEVPEVEEVVDKILVGEGALAAGD